MITDPYSQWRYIGPPRTGSTVLHKLLHDPPVHGTYSGHQHDVEPIPAYKGFYRRVLAAVVPQFKQKLIVSVRDPFKRNVSLWKHRRYEIGLNSTGRQGDDQRVIPVSEHDYPFIQFLQERSRINDDFYRLSLCDWLRYVHPTHYIHQETLWADVQALFPALAGQLAPAVENSSRAAQVQAFPYRDLYCVQRVLELDGPDFERFGYPTTFPLECQYRDA